MRGCRIIKLTLVNPMAHYYSEALRAHSDDRSYPGQTEGLLHGHLEMRAIAQEPQCLTAVVVAGHSTCTRMPSSKSG
ncbi:hypothetical protein AVEN_224143-1 [Araneus ventricosus]|uniref:Uncharacterized protein n=1 Tax=Araneus ventricosus TaxID=182803 RepID=A0A4Y2HDD7_ARAVE|nr:hypothetical protein AVEN_224143-1 [Araneus ventricosus]